MLFGELPFDSENISEMAQFISKAKYHMQGTISVEAKDLINRMLQPNSFKRISVEDILSHPWVSPTKPS